MTEGTARGAAPWDRIGVTATFGIEDVAAPEEMHVAGLLLARLLRQASRARPDLRLPASVALDAGGMVATVTPREGGHEVRLGAPGPVAATVRAPLATLLSVAGGGSEVLALVTGGLRARGSPRALWALRSLLRAARRAP